MSIETKGYIANEKDIGDLTDEILTADGAITESKNWYLRAVTATAVKDMGATPRVRASGRQHKLTDDERKAQMAAVTAVHERFYAVVVERARKRLGKVPAKVLNAKTNFARTAVLSVRNWVRAGHDLTLVGVATLTKAALKVKRTPRPASTAVLKRRLEDRGKALIASALELIDADRDVASTELSLIMSQLATQLLSLGGKTTRNVDQAERTHSPLKVKSTVFIPTETQVVRSMRAPS